MEGNGLSRGLTEERKAVKDLINISSKQGKEEETLETSDSMEIDGWVSNRNQGEKADTAITTRKKKPRRFTHVRSYSARKSELLMKEKSAEMLASVHSFDTLDSTTERESSVLKTHPNVPRPPRVVQPFGSSSGSIIQAKNLLKQFPPRKPRRDSRVFPYVAYSLVKQAEAKLANRAGSMRPDSATGRMSQRPPRPIGNTGTERTGHTVSGKVEKHPRPEEKENKALNQTFQENVYKYMSRSSQEVISLRQKQLRRLNTSLKLAQY